MFPLRDNIPSKRWPIITYFFIGLNAYVFSQEVKLMVDNKLQSFIKDWAVVPVILFSDIASHWTRLLSATFLHGGWMHIISNMWFLFIFGDNVEDRMGHIRYFIFYLTVGILANYLQAALMASSQIPLLGASGAIAGVLGAYFYYFPRAAVLTLIPFGIFSTIREIPAFFFLGFWFIIQILNGTFSMRMATQQSMGGVAWWAHGSGFIFGLVGGLLLGKRR